MELCQLIAKAWSVATLGLIVGVALSWLVEYWPGFGHLAPKWKRIVFLGFCISIPFAAMGAAWASGCPFPPWQDVLLAGLLAFGAGTVAHTRKL